MFLDDRKTFLAFLGYGFAALTGYIVYKLNEIFYPNYATKERLFLWILILGTIVTFFLSNLVRNKEIKCK